MKQQQDVSSQLKRLCTMGPAPESNLMRQSSKMHTHNKKRSKYTQSNKLTRVFGNGLASLFSRQVVSKEPTRMHQRVGNLVDSLQSLSEEQRLQKAVRHFHDAYYGRECRNDIEIMPSIFFTSCYMIQNHILFQDLLYTLSFIFMFFAFIEPSNRFDLEYQVIPDLFYLELIILLFFIADLIMMIMHLSHDIDRNFKQKFTTNYKFICKAVTLVLFIIDYAYYYTYIDIDRLRLAKYLRPCLLCLYNKELRRTIKSMLLSTAQIIQLILFFILMNLFWALIGWQIIGNLDNEVEFNQYMQNFSDLLSATSILYALSSPDIYPDCMLPAYKVSQLYLIYFLSYCILFQLLFLPIPVAIVFDSFRKHRAELAMKDKLQQHESLLACFVTLDIKHDKRLSFEIFDKLMRRIYLNKKRYFPRVHRLFINLDSSQIKQLSINDFFQIIDQMESDPKLNQPLFGDPQLWMKFRKFVNRRFYFKKFAKSMWIEVIMFVVVVFNSVIVIITVISSDDYPSLEEIDNYLVSVYAAEALIKIIGLGVEKYYEDEWNIFDFSLLSLSIFSLFSENIVSFFRTLKTAKSSKIVRITKLNKMFRSIKGIRSLKVLNFLVLGAESLIELKLLVQRLFLCIPLVFKLIPVVLSLFYVWALMGTDLLNTATFEYNSEKNPFSIYDYSDFTSFGNSMLIMFQIQLGTSWNAVVYDYIYKFDSQVKVILYFYSFHILINLIVLALVKGIIWEVFTVVEQSVVEPLDDELPEGNPGQIKERFQAYDEILKEMSGCINQDEDANYKSLSQQFSEMDNIIHAQSVLAIRRRSSRRDGVVEVNDQLQRRLVVRAYFQANFKTIKHLAAILKSHNLNSTRLIDMGKLFDSDDEETLEPYNKQIDDNITSYSSKHYLKRLQDSLVNKEHYEKQKVEYQTTQEVNQNFVFKRALLKDTNSEKVKKFEVDYFQANYGKVFEVINQIDMGPIIKYEGFLLHNFDRALRHNSTNFMTLINLLFMMEKNISNLMLCKGSIFKFVFQDNMGNWIYLDEYQAKVYPCKTDIGPWTYEDELAPNKLYTFLDYFNIEQEADIQEDLLQQFYSLRNMVESNNQTFPNFHLSQTILDCLMFKYYNKDQYDDVSRTSLRLVQTFMDIDELQIQIQKIVVVLVMYSGEKEGAGKNGMYNRNMKEVKLQTLDSLKEQFNNEEEKINEYVSLPLNYVVEFLEDIRIMIYIVFLAILAVLVLVIGVVWYKSQRPKHPSALQLINKTRPLACNLINKTTISHDTILLTFQLPTKLHQLGISVGQHIILHENIRTLENPEGELVERKYTPTSRIDQLGSFDLLIKVYRPLQPRFPNGGKLSSWIEHLQVDQPIHITGPYGKLTYLGRGRVKIGDTIQTFKRIVMIAGGSGITPMYQIIQAIGSDEQDTTKLSLLFANKTEEDILLKQELTTYQKLNKLDLHFTLDMPPSTWTGFIGFVTQDMTSTAFGKLDSQTLALSCGPPMMNTLAQSNYQSLGASITNIHTF